MARRLIHLDTDLGTDPDDLCALALLLAAPDAELAAITTTDDADGERAEEVRECLLLAGRTDVPVASGADPAATTGLLSQSVQRDATVVAIGPLTTLAATERERPGQLRAARVVVMGGWVEPPAPGLPQWGPERDHNIQSDPRAAVAVWEAAGELVLVTLPATLAAHFRAADLPRVRSAGPLGELIARKTEAHARDSGKGELGPAHAALPDDLLNFHYDPVTCAVALGWPVAAPEEMLLTPRIDEAGALHWQRDPAARTVQVARSVDGPAFSARWLEALGRLRY